MRSISAWLSVTSGSISGVIRPQPAGIRLAGIVTMTAPPPPAAASAARLGVANKVRMSATIPARRIRSTKVTASSE